MNKAILIGVTTGLLMVANVAHAYNSSDPGLGVSQPTYPSQSQSGLVIPRDDSRSIQQEQQDRIRRDEQHIKDLEQQRRLDEQRAHQQEQQDRIRRDEQHIKDLEQQRRLDEQRAHQQNY